jgi:adenosylmethionine-8-amino-7-oxononanoate aminotransferase
MHPLAQLDHRYLWHPFTQMRDWLAREPIVIARGRGAVLEDVRGRRYLDANASIWTNLHGHNHPKINAAIQRQLKKIAHSSALGLANEPASRLAEKLVHAANPPELSTLPQPVAASRQSAAEQLSAVRESQRRSYETPLQASLTKVFFSDDGSTAMEVALKLACEYARRAGLGPKPRFLSLGGAYHGDTVGAVSLGHIDLFHRTYAPLLFKTDRVMAPYCYRCRFNRAQPERADARDYRRCQWECVDKVEQAFARRQRRGPAYAALVVEPLVQGAAGMIAQPAGWLGRVAELARGFGTPLIADEVMTGFGRTGSLFACHREGVRPDYLALAKGLTGGYLPMAATLVTQAVFDAFLGDYAEFKTFFHGHSFTGNQLGAAAALASLELLLEPGAARARQALEQRLRAELATLWPLPRVGDIRQAGLVAGIELVRDWRTRAPFDLRERAGIRVCEAMARRGVLTRPIGSVIVLMPPYCATPRQVQRMVAALRDSIQEVFGSAGCL